MMKPTKNIAIIVGVILLLAVGLYFVSMMEPTEQESAPTQAPAISIFTVDKEELAGVSVQNGEEQYQFIEQEGQWKLSGEQGYELDSMRVESLLYEFVSIIASEKLADSVEDLSAYGLDAPKRSVTLALKNGTKSEILIGNTTVDGSLCYVMVGGEPAVYTKTASGCDRLTPSLASFLDLEIYSVGETEVGGVSLRKSGAEEIVLVRKNIAANGEEAVYDWKMTAPLKKSASRYTMNNDLLPNILSLTAAKASTESDALGQIAAEYTIWNLDKSKTYTVIVGKTEEGFTHLKLQGDPAVYLVESETMKFVKLGYMDIVDKTIHVANLTDLQKVEIQALGKQYLLTASGSGNSAVYSVNGQQINSSAFKTAYKSVIGLTMEGYVSQNFSGTPVVTITYTMRDGSVTKVECFAYDQRNYGVCVNGEGTLLLRKNQIDTMVSELDKLS